MIVTVTMNPSVDMSYPLAHLQLDTVNRAEHVSKTAGGKGLNVSRVLHQLGKDLVATGVIGGYLGEYIQAKLDEEVIAHDFTKISQESRNSIAILHDNGLQTEILEKGPTVTPAEEEAFIKHYTQLVSDCRVVTISGSMAAGLSADLYGRLVAIARANDVPVLLDTSGTALKNAVLADAKPFLIKPNETEIAELLGVAKAEAGDLIEQLKAPLFDEIEWIVVSMGADGAIAKHNDAIYQVSIPKINVVNPVGSGDSTLAGLAAAINDGLTDEAVLQLGMTTGMLNTMETKTGCIDPAKVDEYMAQVVVTRID